MSIIQDVAERAAPEWRLRVGGWLFRYRSYTLTAVYLLLLAFTLGRVGRNTSLWPAGLVAVLTGESLRLWAIRHLGRSGRTRQRKARRLVVSGPFALTRNPLYLANLLIAMGAALLLGVAWMVPVVLMLWAIQYHIIVRWEEDLLRERFGQAFRGYCGRVPRWLIRFARPKRGEPRPWRETLHRERDSVLLALALIAAAALLSLWR